MQLPAGYPVSTSTLQSCCFSIEDFKQYTQVAVCAGGKARIIDNVYNEWETIGKILYIPKAKLEMWGRQNSHDPHMCCNKVFDYWFQNPPKDYPVTWRGFTELLEDVPFKALTEELKEALLHKM